MPDQRRLGMQSTDWSKQISAGSKKINLRKNIQNKIYIKSISSSEKLQGQKERIRRYIKESDVDIMSLQAINSIFLDCDSEGIGYITKKSLLLKIAEEGVAFPAEFLFNLIQDLQKDPQDYSEDAILVYDYLTSIIQIYNNCPIFLKGDSNNSDNVRTNMLDQNGGKELEISYDRIDKLLRQVNSRLDEKFKDYRHAFRFFDKDFGGSINFKEFITGMEESGIKLKLADYRLIFDFIDHDQTGEVGFNKFCLLNIDRKQEVLRLKHQQLEKLQTQKSRGSRKPPLPPLSVTGESTKTSTHPLLGECIPKNKDVNIFNKDIQNQTLVQKYLQRKKVREATKEGYKTVADLPKDFKYGCNEKDVPHDMVAILAGSYQENLKKLSIEDLRNTLARQRIPSAKPTYATLLRDKANRIKYVRRNSLTISVNGSEVKSAKSRKNFMVQGSNEFMMNRSSHNSSFTSKTKL